MVSDSVNDGFKLYMKFAKLLCLRLPDEKDRIVATKWLKKLENQSKANKNDLRLHYLKLILISLKRQKLVEPFRNPPKPSGSLECFKKEYQPDDIRQSIKKEEAHEATATYLRDISGNFREYVAYQKIPNFGAHFYYGCSPEHISQWDNFETLITSNDNCCIKKCSPPKEQIICSESLKAKVPEQLHCKVLPVQYLNQNPDNNTNYSNEQTFDDHKNQSNPEEKFLQKTWKYEDYYRDGDNEKELYNIPNKAPAECDHNSDEHFQTNESSSNGYLRYPSNGMDSFVADTAEEKLKNIYGINTTPVKPQQENRAARVQKLYNAINHKINNFQLNYCTTNTNTNQHCDQYYYSKPKPKPCIENKNNHTKENLKKKIAEIANFDYIEDFEKTLSSRLTELSAGIQNFLNAKK